MDSVLDHQDVPRRALSADTRMPNEGVRGPGRHVVHLAGRLGSGVVASIRTLTSHLAEAGVGQTLLSLERSFGARDHVHDSVEWLTVSTNRTGSLARWASLRHQFRLLVEASTVTDVHLHGVAAAWIGIRELRRQPRPVRVFVSLHSARSRGVMVRLAELACRASMMTSRSLRIGIIAEDAAEARRFGAWRSRAAILSAVSS